MTRRIRQTSALAISAVVITLVGTSALGQSAPSGSKLVQTVEQRVDLINREETHPLRRSSMIAVAPPKPREFAVHDLVQIVVRETSRVNSEQSVESEKRYDLQGSIEAWPDLRLADLLEFQVRAGRTTDLPRVDVGIDKEFEGEGEYERNDDLSARLTAEIIEVLPNGNLILEARTYIKTDTEEATMKVTGTCRPQDVTAANTVLSNQLHDLRIEKMHEGQLRKTAEKGLIAKLFDAIFAF